MTLAALKEFTLTQAADFYYIRPSQSPRFTFEKLFKINKKDKKCCYTLFYNFKSKRNIRLFVFWEGTRYIVFCSRKQLQ